MYLFDHREWTSKQNRFGRDREPERKRKAIEYLWYNWLYILIKMPVSAFIGLHILRLFLCDISLSFVRSRAAFRLNLRIYGQITTRTTKWTVYYALEISELNYFVLSPSLSSPPSSWSSSTSRFVTMNQVLWSEQNQTNAIIFLINFSVLHNLHIFVCCKWQSSPAAAVSIHPTPFTRRTLPSPMDRTLFELSAPCVAAWEIKL